MLTLTAAEVDAITDANNTLQITGENNDTLNVVGAVNTGTTQLINGMPTTSTPSAVPPC